MLHSQTESVADGRCVQVLDISDFRFPGGTSASIAEEITAQSSAGWTTGLIHLNTPRVARAAAFDPRIRQRVTDGRARLLLGRDPVRADVTVIRHPTDFEQAADQLPPISTEQVLLVADTTVIGTDGTAEYDPAEITRLVQERFGRTPRWAPLSAEIRSQLERAAPALDLVADDWVNVIDGNAAPAAVRAERPGHQVHRDRLRQLAGLQPRNPDPVRTTPSPGSTASSARRSAGARPQDRPVLLLISSNGTGMGHLMRLMAYGRRAIEFEPQVLSMSQGVGAVAALGMPYEYLPSAGALGMDSRNWQPIFTERVGHALDRIRPSIVVFDGTWPYAGIEELRSSHPDPLWVWSRRGMWMPDRGGEQLSTSVWFDEVIEPGDFAGAADVGATTTASATRIPPVTLLDADDLLSRAAARHELGLPADGPLALVSFSGGTVQDVGSDTAAAIEACRKLGVEVCVTRSVVAPHIALPPDVHVVNPIPLATYQHAFDVAISAAGYNSFHELLRFGTPTLFIPKRNSALDDQDRRARWAADQGWSHYATHVSADGTAEVLADLLDHGDDMIARIARQDPGNGAVDAAKVLADLHARRDVRKRGTW